MSTPPASTSSQPAQPQSGGFASSSPNGGYTYQQSPQQPNSGGSGSNPSPNPSSQATMLPPLLQFIQQPMQHQMSSLQQQQQMLYHQHIQNQQNQQNQQMQYVQFKQQQQHQHQHQLQQLHQQQQQLHQQQQQQQHQQQPTQQQQQFQIQQLKMQEFQFKQQSIPLQQQQQQQQQSQTNYGMMNLAMAAGDDAIAKKRIIETDNLIRLVCEPNNTNSAAQEQPGSPSPKKKKTKKQSAAAQSIYTPLHDMSKMEELANDLCCKKKGRGRPSLVYKAMKDRLETVIGGSTNLSEIEPSTLLPHLVQIRDQLEAEEAAQAALAAVAAATAEGNASQELTESGSADGEAGWNGFENGQYQSVGTPGVVKRGRGRPRKYDQSGVGPDDDKNKTSKAPKAPKPKIDANGNPIDPNSEPKRKRGRPKKNPDDITPSKKQKGDESETVLMESGGSQIPFLSIADINPRNLLGTDPGMYANLMHQNLYQPQVHGMMFAGAMGGIHAMPQMHPHLVGQSGMSLVADPRTQDPSVYYNMVNQEGQVTKSDANQYQSEEDVEGSDSEFKNENEEEEEEADDVEEDVEEAEDRAGVEEQAEDAEEEEDDEEESVEGDDA
eukprot:TRINITY_DN1814_c0_g1_i1.p1 TRINITY_DN1814_c0_g1~~TRINITY_DN1814_c0_g1_i1.p1  ORF type:complete len:607 (-),score=223.66 TRINITY_DN1814_c0_g1_i1:78-1898(-)